MHRKAMPATRIHALLLCSAALCMSACADPTADRKPLPDWSDGYERGNGGQAEPDAGTDPDAGSVPRDSFAIVRPSDVTWPMRLHKADQASEACSIAYDPNIEYQSSKDIECIVDHDELDLWVLGLQYDIVVPEGMCEFILHVPYIFSNFEVGAGPENVSYTVNEDGTFSDEVNAMDGEPYCAFDYSKQNEDAPNCCTGGYTLEVKSALTGKTSTSNKQWGGKPGDCYYGAGYLEDGVVLNAQGFPEPKYTYLKRTAHVEHVVYKGISDKYPSNVPLANYWQDADHAGGPPAALAAAYARPYYEVFCLDDAQEIVAHIKLRVREWNEETEFVDDGNPDTKGTEPGWKLPLDSINDVTDWADLTPGGQGFPSIPLVK